MTIKQEESNKWQPEGETCTINMTNCQIWCKELLQINNWKRYEQAIRGKAKSSKHKKLLTLLNKEV